MITEADLDGQRRINYEELYKMMIFSRRWFAPFSRPNIVDSTHNSLHRELDLKRPVFSRTKLNVWTSEKGSQHEVLKTEKCDHYERRSNSQKIDIPRKCINP